MSAALQASLPNMYPFKAMSTGCRNPLAAGGSPRRHRVRVTASLLPCDSAQHP